MTLTLRCYAQRLDRQCHAICTDLDIAADGATLEEARASLAACIELYLEGVYEFPPEERRRFRTSRSPWYVRARFTILTSFHRLRNDAGRPTGFVPESHVPAPAQS